MVAGRLNRDNRNVRKRTVEMYARDMVAGRWVANRRGLQRTGRGLCPECSLRVEYGMPVETQQQESLL